MLCLRQSRQRNGFAIANQIKKQGIDLLSMAGREIQRLLGISHGQYERSRISKIWIGLLYSNLNSNPIQDLNEIESMAQIP
jgi:hypothetical protein